MSLLTLLRASFSSRLLAVLLVCASAVAGFATYRVMVDAPDALSQGVYSSNVLAWLLVDGVLLISLAALVVARVVRIVMERRRGFAGSELMTRIVVMFSLVALLPTLCMAVFSALFFQYGIQAWFNERVNGAVEASVAVAEGYLGEHKKIIQADIMGMANDLNREAYRIRQAPNSLNQMITILAGIRKVPEAIMFQRTPDGHISVLARTPISYALEFFLESTPGDIFGKAAEGELVTFTQNQSNVGDDASSDRVVALIKLENFFDTYLLVGRFIDATILKHMEMTRGAANEYRALKSSMHRVQVMFYFVFTVLALLLLLVAMWFGMLLANALVAPVKSLIEATETIQRGEWNVQVPIVPGSGEMQLLAQAFNRMTTELEKQRRELISVERRAAWADVARRIAHEIKNPLTPIHLAAERLKRKYGKEVSDVENFEKYTGTIMRHVADIGRIVDEFVQFARLPSPQFRSVDLVELLKQSLFSREVTAPQVVFEFSTQEDAFWMEGDPQQLGQVFDNVLKNSVEAVEEKFGDRTGGRIRVILTREEGDLGTMLRVEDNGNGFPADMMERLTEPYVTRKVKGTGLGLAIVKKILEDHGAVLRFLNPEEGGACVHIHFRGSVAKGQL